jgi:hypothetical protein
LEAISFPSGLIVRDAWNAKSFSRAYMTPAIDEVVLGAGATRHVGLLSMVCRARVDTNGGDSFRDSRSGCEFGEASVSRIDGNQRLAILGLRQRIEAAAPGYPKTRLAKVSRFCGF